MPNVTNSIFQKKRKAGSVPFQAEEPIPLTAKTLQELKTEQQQLLVEQEQVMERIKTAREMGDLSENGAYKYGKFELGRVRRRLGEINKLLRLGVVIKKQQTGTVLFGNKVTIQSKQRKMSFTLVSEFESDPTKGKLSNKSPIGSAVFKSSVGDVVSATLPTGVEEFEVLEIE